VFYKIAPIPGFEWLDGGPLSATFDQKNNRLIFKGCNYNNSCRIYSIDVLTGEIISEPLFPIQFGSADNIIGYHYDNELDLLFALH
jgi:hypothetical protein